MRNGELREACGFDPTLGGKAVPSKDAYSSMLKKLMKKQKEIDRMGSTDGVKSLFLTKTGKQRVNGVEWGLNLSL